MKNYAFFIDKAIPLIDRDYFLFLRHAIESAKYRIWISMFIININRNHDSEIEVREILKLLSYKKSLGVDVRVIVGNSENYIMKKTNSVAKKFLLSKKIPTKKYKGSKKSTHNKYVIIDDDLLILGSHNWTNNAFNVSAEDSIAIYSKNFNSEASQQFLATWMD